MLEAVEQSDTDMQLDHLTLEAAGHHALTEPLEAMHLGLDKAALYTPQFVLRYRPRFFSSLIPTDDPAGIGGLCNKADLCNNA